MHVSALDWRKNLLWDWRLTSLWYWRWISRGPSRPCYKTCAVAWTPEEAGLMVLNLHPVPGLNPKQGAEFLCYMFLPSAEQLWKRITLVKEWVWGKHRSFFATSTRIIAAGQT